MAVKNKIFIPNEYYFVTFTILGWRNIFTSDNYCNLVYKWFDYVRDKYGNEINAYVVMPNHIHLLIKISDRSKKLPILVMNAKRFLAYEIVQLLSAENKSELLEFFEINSRKNARHKIFEDSYDSLIIQSLKFFLQKLNYIHNNPCQEKWKLAEDPESYKHSSAANYILGSGYYNNISIIDF
jgi:REP element-mobilizing transposase RayT